MEKNASETEATKAAARKRHLVVYTALFAVRLVVLIGALILLLGIPDMPLVASLPLFGLPFMLYFIVSTVLARRRIRQTSILLALDLPVYAIWTSLATFVPGIVFEFLRIH